MVEYAVNPNNEEKQLRCEKVLEHAVGCSDNVDCEGKCKRMKIVLGHIRHCPRPVGASCELCKGLIGLLVFHAKRCKIDNCRIPYCEKIKSERKEANRVVEE